MAGLVQGDGLRGRIRWAAAALCVIVAVAYLSVFLSLLPTLGQVGDDPTPLFAVLASVYVVGAVLLLYRDSSALHWAGGALQIILLSSYFGITVIGEMQHPDPMAAQPFALRFLAQGIVIGAAQLILAGALIYLASSRRDSRSSAHRSGS